jgi:hypothetical protein
VLHERTAGLVPLSLSQVRRISADVAQRQRPPLDVIAAAPVGEESTYAEVVLTVRGCRAEPCILMIGVDRNSSEQQFREVVSARLEEHLLQHQMAPQR